MIINCFEKYEKNFDINQKVDMVTINGAGETYDLKPFIYKPIRMAYDEEGIQFNSVIFTELKALLKEAELLFSLTTVKTSLYSHTR